MSCDDSGVSLNWTAPSHFLGTEIVYNIMVTIDGSYMVNATTHSNHTFSYSDLGISCCLDYSVTFMVRSVHVNPMDEGNATSTTVNIQREDNNLCGITLTEQPLGSWIF